MKFSPHRILFLPLLVLGIWSTLPAQETIQLAYDNTITRLPAWDDDNIVSVAFPTDIVLPGAPSVFLSKVDETVGAVIIENTGTVQRTITIENETFIIQSGSRKYLTLPQRPDILLSSSTSLLDLKISKIYVKKPTFVAGNRNFGFGADLPCEVLVNCPEGRAYSRESKGVVRIWMLLEEGIGYCSGSFVNNTAEDKTPYILSAFHCVDGYTPMWDEWEFDIGFESYLCDAISHPPGDYTFIGCDYIAGDQETDFLLLELEEDVGDLPVAFLGWNRQGDYRPDTAVMIHHPQGDLKSISLNTDGISTNSNNIFWSNDVVSPPNTHLMCHLDIGTFEGGSSGAPLTDTEGRIIGQLHGGRADCEEFLTFAGRLSLSWNGSTPSNRLKDWLDPLNTGQTTLDVLNQGPVGKYVTVEGTARNDAGDPISNTIVGIRGISLLDTTNRQGEYTFEYFLNGLPDTLYAIKDDVHLNGVNVLDIVKLRKYLLGLEGYDFPYEFIASDVNLDRRINVLDFVAMRKLVLGFIQEFNSFPPWFFFGEDGIIELDHHTDLLLRGYKMGDLDNTATPDN